MEEQTQQIQLKIKANKKISHVGEILGHVVFKSVVLVNTKGRIYNCLCDCGKYFTLDYQSIKRSNHKSCGCKVIHKNNLKHGCGSQKKGITAEYSAWINLKKRCYNKKNGDFSNYGGRGIIVCDRWKYSFDNFLADMGERPSSRYSIDRINVNGNYEPSNCRWATTLIQCNNRRSNVKFEFKGELKTRAEIALELGISYGKAVWIYPSHHKQKKDSRAKIVLNIETGIFYKNATEAANSINVSPAFLYKYLSNNINNKINFIYAN